ncbi:hypothetical protein CQA53_08875 [Helicobacter didelphidarum]|uniref:Plasmid replication protein RepL domain-containing protein n=1 Tax=Helicobacter didelphidarum TaxID=2040648 RepID=A0A3D8ICJ8_9HELI|nr:hypothetical protein [Helicobacter didelphidarum]RDU62923.1 hypothetical protein CQA53_08875 [Helicobacter didelphidarum]
MGQTIIKILNQQKSEDVKFYKDKLIFFSRLDGKTLYFLMYMIQELVDYNKNYIELTNSFRTSCEKKLNFKLGGNSVPLHLMKLAKNGFIKKVGNSRCLYNPHLFYYADDEVAKTMQENFICDFDYENLKITISKVIHDDKVYLG